MFVLALREHDSYRSDLKAIWQQGKTNTIYVSVCLCYCYQVQFVTTTFKLGMMCSGNMWLFLVAALQVLRGLLRTSAAESPCPDVFQYIGSPGLEYGIITLPIPYPYLAIDITVSLYVTAAVSSIGSGKLKPLDNEILKKMSAGSRDPVLYRIDFPVSSQLPAIKSININNIVICTGSKPNAAYVNTFKLQHAINNEICNSANLDCPFSIQQSAEIRPQLSPNGDSQTGPGRLPLPPLQGGSRPGGDTNTRCGILATSRVRRVVNGQDTLPGLWPWHAAVYLRRGSNTAYWCGGTFVGSRTIITSGICVTKGTGEVMPQDELIVALGRYDLRMRKEEGTQEKEVQRILRHPEYNQRNLEADIVLLILSSSVDYTRFVRPVCLWNPEDTRLESVTGKDGVVVGWGRDEHGLSAQKLKMAVASVVSRDTCYKQNEEYYMRYLHPNAFCAGFANGTSICTGEVGGGLVIPVREQGDIKVWKLRGIISNIGIGDKSCVPNSYTVFTDVAQYLPWINDNII